MVSLAEFGERNAVKELMRVFDRGYSPGLGDDCGIIPFGDQYLLLTTDVVNEKTHFPKGTTPYDMGWYSVAVNLSDVAAMGGYPLAFIAALTLPRTTDLSLLREVARGMDACTKEYGVAVYGGDTKEGDSISIAGVALGRVSKDRILLRKGSKVGDIIAVTGEIGRGGWAAETIRKTGSNKEAIETLLHPSPRLEEGRHLAESGAVTACMDTSDGLASTLHQMREQNATGFEVEQGRLPFYPKLRTMPAPDMTRLAIYHGGDYELVATVKPEEYENLRATLAKHNAHLTAIGHVTKDKDCVLVTDKGREQIADRGWEHFRAVPL
jgi:thiamine-monophosphate kinase